jgi:hypothetical protein
MRKYLLTYAQPYEFDDGTAGNAHEIRWADETHVIESKNDDDAVYVAEMHLRQRCATTVGYRGGHHEKRRFFSLKEIRDVSSKVAEDDMCADHEKKQVA